MATSATPKKSTAKKKPQSAARQWKRAKGEDLDVPSGNTALVKRPGMEVFLLEGLIPDTLMPIINEAIRTGAGLPPEKVKAISEDLDQVGSMMEAMDRVVVRVVIEPKVLWHKRLVVDEDGSPIFDAEGKEQFETIPENERNLDKDGEPLPEEEEALYTDDLDLEDKIFIFNYAVGGTRDLERFRKETGATLDSIQNGEDVRD